MNPEELKLILNTLSTVTESVLYTVMWWISFHYVLRFMKDITQLIAKFPSAEPGTEEVCDKAIKSGLENQSDCST